MTDTNNNRDKARDVFWRLHEVTHRGHIEYMAHVRRLEDFYLGGGRQWLPEDRATIEGEGRPCHEVNIIKQSVNAAAGYQIANRVDVSFLPKGGRGDERTAKLLGKTIKHVNTNARYRYHETDCFLDGMIQQRGYIDLRMSYEDNVLGEIAMRTVDPMDGIPDPDAKEYDPDTWADWRETRWLTERELEGNYGKDAAKAVVDNSHAYTNEENFGTEYVRREGFAELPPSYAMGRGWYEDDGRHRRYRIVDQQSNEYMQALCAVWPTGDIRIVEGFEREKLAWLIDQGIAVMKRRVRRVRWEVCAPEVCIVDKVSPYEHISVVPYFPYFRRGRTVGMIDDMVSPQEMLNKFISQYAAVVNSSANGGWQGEAGSLANMTDEEFVENASSSNLILLRKTGKQPFTKIEANKVPEGLDRMVGFAKEHLQQTSGVDENLSGAQRDGMSGVAIQSLQYASQQKLALPLDNLSRTRHLVAARELKLIQQFMGNERIIRITEVDAYGVDRQQMVPLNQIQDDGSVLNDLTVGEYDVEVTERPAQVTFDNSEFEQMKSMRVDMGIPIPDATIVKASSLADKSEIAEVLESAQGKPDPEAEAQAALIQAQTEKAKAEAVTKSIEAQYSAIQTATAIVVTPQAAALADQLLRSGGYVDRDAAPIVPEAPAGVTAAPMGANTNPLTPMNPGVGLNAGLSDGPTQPPV